MDRQSLNGHLHHVVDALVKSTDAQSLLSHLSGVALPNREEVKDIIGLLRQIVFPGYFGKPGLTRETLSFELGRLLVEVSGKLFDQVSCCLRYIEDTCKPDDVARCDQTAGTLVRDFLDRLPAVREILATDVQAAFDSDPAATSTDETIFCYPGLFTITVQRLAHEFYKLGVPLLPRIMTEYAHSTTGIEIHPGAQLGKRFFIDHGTGVVIGETCAIGDDVKVYQGVTLGALSPAYGQMLRGLKRHPTIEDNVTIYAGATILGGETIIGKGTVIGGNVFVTSSVPPSNQVSAEPPKLKFRERGKKREEIWDFQI